MSMMNSEQIQACRNSPLAAYLAKHLPAMLWAVLLLNAGALMLLLMGMTFFLSPTLLPGASTVHTLTIVFCSVISISGVVLGLELAWMRRYQISPESFAPLVDHMDGSPLPYEVDQPKSPFVPEPQDLSHVAHLVISALRIRASVSGRQHKNALSKMHAEYLRSLEIQACALADMIEAGVRSLDEKIDYGFTGSQAGFRQLEMTRETLQRIVRIAQAANRTLHVSKGKQKKNLQRSDCRP